MTEQRKAIELLEIALAQINENTNAINTLYLFLQRPEKWTDGVENHLKSNNKVIEDINEYLKDNAIINTGE